MMVVIVVDHVSIPNIVMTVNALEMVKLVLETMHSLQMEYAKMTWTKYIVIMMDLIAAALIATSTIAQNAIAKVIKSSRARIFYNVNHL